jgi:hypothetical protein
MKDCDILVIGAGIAGLSAAHRLHAAGWQVAVIDKGRGPGGRMATRRDGASSWDHGAQYFSVKTPGFRQLASEALEAGILKSWTPAHLADNHPRFAGSAGMNAWPKYLASGLTVHTSQKVVRIEMESTGWVLQMESGASARCRALLVTLPAPQVLALLNSSGLSLPAAQAALGEIAYHPCIAVLARLDRPSELPAPGGLLLAEQPIAWMADNHQKGISEEPTLTIHAAPAFSREHLDGDLNAAGQQLAALAQPYLGAAGITAFQVHRWRYSLAYRRHPEPFLSATAPFPLLFGGDGFGETGHVEGACISGMAMADWLMEQLAQ